MERYRAAVQPEGVVCPPPPVADWYGEQVAPTPARVQRAASPAIILYEADQPARDLDSESDTAAISSETHHSSPAHILARVRAPYDAGEHSLARLLKGLRRSESPGDQAADESEPEVVSYPTACGSFSFPELYERSRKYAAFVLHHSYHLPTDELEDGLQAGGVMLWKHLHQQADGLQDKNLSWVGMKVVYSALHATRGDWQYRQRAQSAEGEEAKSGWGTHSGESRQADQRTDIQQAIATVAERIMTEEKGKRRDHDMWALYGLTMLQVGAGEASRLFAVREQSMGKAYRRVRQMLQEALPNYRPLGDTQPYRQHGRQALPEQDLTAIRERNGSVQEAVLVSVQKQIERLNADTRTQDEVALAGIREHIPALTQARKYGIAQWTMQRAYRRVHLLIAAECDPTVRVPRPERRVKSVFTLTEESGAAVEQLALQLLEQPRSYEKLVALHAHISNLGISTTAKHFNIPTSTLRYYSQQIGKRLQTPTQAAREGRVRHKDEQHQGEVTIYSWQSAAD